MTPGQRIRVFIAGDIYPKAGLVRRFLEDDGYAVVGTTSSRKTMIAAIRKTEPDAVVVDEGLLVAGIDGGTLAKIRNAVPDAKVIVFTAAPLGAGSPAAGADGYLQKGVGLSSLTALLGKTFVDEPARVEPLAAVGAGARVASSARVSDVASERVPVAATNGNGAGASARLVAIASGAVLVVWGMIAMLAGGGGPTPPPLDRTEGTPEGNVAFESGIVDAYASLRGLVDAIESGDYGLASDEAKALLEARQLAKEQGYAIGTIRELDAAIAARLRGVVDVLPLRVDTTLSSILGDLYPEPDEDVTGGGGVIFGPILGGDTSGDTSDAGGTGGTDTDADGAGGGDTGGGGDGTDGNGGGGGGNGGGGDGSVSLGPGDGRAWGHSHKERHVPGEVPPWANGKGVGHGKNGHDGPGGNGVAHRLE